MLFREVFILTKSQKAKLFDFQFLQLKKILKFGRNKAQNCEPDILI